MELHSDLIQCGPPGESAIAKYDQNKPPNEQDADIPTVFIDAMQVREQVFVREQNVPAEDELDSDDAHAYHWVIYVSKLQAPSSQPIPPSGTIRLLLPLNPQSPLPPHSAQTAPHPARWPREPYILLGRLAVVPAHRGSTLRLARKLVEGALEWARGQRRSRTCVSSCMCACASSHNCGDKAVTVGLTGPAATTVDEDMQIHDGEPSCKCRCECGHGCGRGSEYSMRGGYWSNWQGLVVVHSQQGRAEGVWSRYGFEKDEEMGEWDEVGIIHVGMWKRV